MKTRTRRLSAPLLVACVSATIWAAPASASEPLSFEQVIGRPRHVAPEAVAVDASGNVYVADSNFLADETDDRLVKYDADGVLLDVIAGPGQDAPDLYDPTAIAISPVSGDIYVVQKGASDDRVQRYDALGNYLGTWGSFGTGNGQFRNPEGIAVDSTGAVYVADTSNGRVQKFTATGVWSASWDVTGVNGLTVSSSDVVYVVGGNMVRTYTTAGSFIAEWAASGATGVAVDASGNAWVTSTGDVVRRYEPDGDALAVLGSAGWEDGQFTDPQGIAFAPSGDVYVGDQGNGRIQRFSGAGAYETQWGRYPGDGVMDLPTGLVVDADDNVYATNAGQDLIQKFDATGAFVTQWGGSGNGNGELNDPAGLAVGPDGTVYVADTENQRIQAFDADGTYITQWGGFGTAVGQVHDPAAVAVDAAGNVYVADKNNHRIQKFTSTGAFITSWGAQGNGNGQLRNPSALVVGPDGNIWVADTTNSRIQSFTPAGTWLSTWGEGGMEDGQFLTPTGIAFDAAGTVWVADKGMHRIQRFTAAGQFLSKLGTEGIDVGDFSQPSQLAIDSSDRVLVADTSNDRVQVFVDANGPDTTVLTGPPLVSAADSATFTFEANEPGSTFECKLDAGDWASCASGVTFEDLAPGVHSLSIRATDDLGFLGNPTVYDWDIDVIPPVTSIDVAPGLETADEIATFEFSANEDVAFFTCTVDGGVPDECVSPKEVLVTSGTHNFKVRATDLAGNTGANATYTWTLDDEPPTVTIESGPNGYTVETDATFTFESPEATATFECRLDSLAWGDCSSPKTYPTVDPGQHTFRVRAIDELGNVGTDDAQTWIVDAATHLPDAQIAKGTTYVGDDVYNTTGKNQSRSGSAAVGKTVTFKIRLQNDGDDQDTYTVKGPGSASGYTLTYLDGTTKINDQVKAGTYEVDLDAGESKVLTFKVKLGSGAAASKSFLITIASQHDPSVKDAVKAVVKKA